MKVEAASFSEKSVTKIPSTGYLYIRLWYSTTFLYGGGVPLWWKYTVIIHPCSKKRCKKAQTTELFALVQCWKW